MTDEYVTIARSLGEDIQAGFAESRAEGKANREAMMRILDRLPPAGGEGDG
ncbi:MAG TPA: hypothetical protein VFN92_00160 [Solirubrobacterales bacterium]|nr:hypothetical protein [Solirubrobacterales bacterium]